jgi:hypothetical protein
MASDRPDVTIKNTYSGAAVVFEVRVSNPMSTGLRSLFLEPRPVPAKVPVDRDRHHIPLLRGRGSRMVIFRLRPGPQDHVVSLDVVLTWEDEVGASRGRMEVAGRPVDLSLPKLRGPKEGIERWRLGLRAGSAVEVRLRMEPDPDSLLDILEGPMKGLPGELSIQREEGPRGRIGRVWVRGEGSKGRRVGLLVDITPDPRTGGSRVLVTVSGSTDELLTAFYHRCLEVLSPVLPALEDLVPHSLTEAP